MKAKENAYAPYSGLCRSLVLRHRMAEFILSGCNVENSSFGAAICAERTAIVKAVSEGSTKISAIAITSDSDRLTYPCGICRQVISEFAGDDIKIICSDKKGQYKIYGMNDILPHAFTREDME